MVSVQELIDDDDLDEPEVSNAPAEQGKQTATVPSAKLPTFSKVDMKQLQAELDEVDAENNVKIGALQHTAEKDTEKLDSLEQVRC